MKLYYNRKLKKSGVCHYMFNIFSGNFKECSKSICDYLKFSKLQKKKSTLIYIEYFFRVL